MCWFCYLLLTCCTFTAHSHADYRLSDKREGGWPRLPKDGNAGIWTRIFTTIKSKLRNVLEFVKLLPDSKKLEWDDPWNIAEYRSNALVTIKVQDKQTQQSFAIGNFHMPCCFYAPPVMTIHVDLAARHVQRLAQQSGSNMPYILAGDWNIKPDSSQYRLLTTGKMDKGDPEWPAPRYGMTWEPSAKPMSSAYRLANGKEPNFTNYARIGEQEPFIDTLDYIFLGNSNNDVGGKKWSVKSVKPLPHRDEAGGPFPNLDRGEPSDHVLIAADLELK
jgi:2',5'-phosphodiesterase